MGWYPGYLETYGQEEAISFCWLLTACAILDWDVEKALAHSASWLL